MRFPTILFVLLLTACGSSGTSVFDRSGSTVGRVSVASDDRATVFDRNGSIVGFAGAGSLVGIRPQFDSRPGVRSRAGVA